jgi:hypothetical protein
LVGAKEKEPIRSERSAERAAVLIAAEAVIDTLTGHGIDGVEPVRRVESVIADELEQITMKQIRACCESNWSCFVVAS